MRIRALIAALAIALAVPVAAQDELPPAMKVLAAHDASLGPAEKVAALERLRLTGSVIAPSMPQMKGEQVGVYSGYLFQTKTSTKGMGTTSQGSDGTHCWSTDPAMGINVITGVERGPILRQAAVEMRRPWHAMYAAAKTVGSEEVDGRSCWKLTMTPSKGEAETWFVDAKDGRLRKFLTTVPDMMGGKLRVAFVYSDFKKVGGIDFPHKKRMLAGVFEVVTSISKVEINPKIDASELAPPADVLARINDPKRKKKSSPEPGKCTVEKVEKRHVASIRFKAKKTAISSALAIALPEVMAHLGKMGVAPAGPPFTRYHGEDEEHFDLEAGIPVAKPIEEGGRVKASTLPGGRAATVWHGGEYHKLPSTYALLQKWAREKKLEFAGGWFELYWTDPGLEPDPKNWRTQIIWPIK